jgi:Signal transduction protein containing GAF and PtsI domains
VPIIHRAQVQGVLTVHQSEARDFAEEEVAFLVTLSAQLGGEIAQSRARGQLREVVQARKRKRKTDTVLAGVTGSLGVAIGKAVVVYPPADLDAVPDRVVNDTENQIEIFEHALGLARDEVEAIHERSKQLFSSAENALFEAYLRILDSRSLMNEVEDEIKEGQWAQGALKRVIQRHVMQFESLDDSYLAERAADFRDLGRRILAYMQSSKRAQVEYPKNTVLVSDEVTATAILEVPQGQLVGVVSGSGSSNSHVAILANALGLPAVMGVEGALLSDLAGLETLV